MVTALASAFVLSLGAIGCEDDSTDEHDAAVGDAGKDAATPDTGGTSQKVEIAFEGKVGSQAFDCTKSFELGSEKTSVKPLDFKFYVHDVKLITASGSEQALDLDQDGTWQFEHVALLDFENKSGSSTV